MSLKEEIRTVIGNRRKFLLLRIADVDAETARNLCKIKKGTYNTWLQDSRFTELYRRRDEWAGVYKQEAIQLLRRDNQLNAVLLEEKIINKMKEEVESGEYNLIRTILARDVYAKLINDLDYQPQTQVMSWEQRLQQVFLQKPEQEVISAPVIEAASSQLAEHQESLLITEGEQEPPPTDEEIES